MIDEGSLLEMRIWSILLIKNGVYILVEVSFYISNGSHASLVYTYY